MRRAGIAPTSPSGLAQSSMQVGIPEGSHRRSRHKADLAPMISGQSLPHPKPQFTHLKLWILDSLWGHQAPVVCCWRRLGCCPFRELWHNCRNDSKLEEAQCHSELPGKRSTSLGGKPRGLRSLMEAILRKRVAVYGSRNNSCWSLDPVWFSSDIYRCQTSIFKNLKGCHGAEGRDFLCDPVGRTSTVGK